MDYVDTLIAILEQNKNRNNDLCSGGINCSGMECSKCAFDRHQRNEAIAEFKRLRAGGNKDE